MFRFFCRHKWEEISKEILPSAWEQFVSSNFTTKPLEIPPWAFVKKLVVILSCQKCGKLREMIEECPSDHYVSGDKTIYHKFELDECGEEI